jgi:hypothetical protein
MNNSEKDIIVAEVVNKLVWKGVGGLLAVLAITITIASLIAEKGDMGPSGEPGKPPSKAELQEIIVAQMSSVPKQVTPLLQIDIANVESKLTTKLKAIKQWDDDSIERTKWVSVTRAEYGSICPRHKYVTGIEFEGKATGDAIGSPIKVRLVCQSLNAN